MFKEYHIPNIAPSCKVPTKSLCFAASFSEFSGTEAEAALACKSFESNNDDDKFPLLPKMTELELIEEENEEVCVCL